MTAQALFAPDLLNKLEATSSGGKASEWRGRGQTSALVGDMLKSCEVNSLSLPSPSPSNRLRCSSFGHARAFLSCSAVRREAMANMKTRCAGNFPDVRCLIWNQKKWRRSRPAAVPFICWRTSRWVYCWPHVNVCVCMLNSKDAFRKSES